MYTFRQPDNITTRENTNNTMKNVLARSVVLSQ